MPALSEMSFADHVIAVREASKRKLNAKIDKYEQEETRYEPNRITPFKIPTLVTTVGRGMSCAGRNSLNRYLRATGLSGIEHEFTRTTAIYGVRKDETKYLISHSVMKMPVVIPGKNKLGFVMVPILDQSEKLRNLPIRLREYRIPRAEDRSLYPLVDVPKAGEVYDLFPFPAGKGCYDEGQTRVLIKEEIDEELSKEMIEEDLEKGIVHVVFRKRDGSKRTLRGTTNKGFIPRSKHPKEGELEKRARDGVAKVGSLASGAKMVIKTFVKSVFTIFATNASFWRVFANLQI